MKKLLLTAVIASSIFAAKAQDAKNTIKINPLSAFLSTGSVFYERKLDENSSLQLGVAYSGLKLNDIGYHGVVITPEYRFYTGKKAIEGLYFAPFLRYQHFNVKANENEGNLSTYGGGILLGRQWVFTTGFALDLFAGPSYSSGDYKITAGSEPNLSGNIEGMGIRIGIALGLGF